MTAYNPTPVHKLLDSKFAELVDYANRGYLRVAEALEVHIAKPGESQISRFFESQAEVVGAIKLVDLITNELRDQQAFMDGKAAAEEDTDLGSMAKSA